MSRIYFLPYVDNCLVWIHMFTHPPNATHLKKLQCFVCVTWDHKIKNFGLLSLVLPEETIKKQESCTVYPHLYPGKLLNVLPFSTKSPVTPVLPERPELLGLKWTPGLTMHQAKELSPYEVGDRRWRASVKQLASGERNFIFVANLSQYAQFFFTLSFELSLSFLDEDGFALQCSFDATYIFVRCHF